MAAVPSVAAEAPAAAAAAAKIEKNAEFWCTTTVSLLRKLLLTKAKMLNVQTAVWFKKAKISNFNFQKRRKFFGYHPREGF